MKTSEILAAMVDKEGAVYFKDVKNGAPVDKDRELVYYHLKRLVKEGHVLKEQDTNGNSIYRCQSCYYDKNNTAVAEAVLRILMAQAEKTALGTVLNPLDAAFMMLEMAAFRVNKN